MRDSIKEPMSRLKDRGAGGRRRAARAVDCLHRCMHYEILPGDLWSRMPRERKLHALCVTVFVIGCLRALSQSPLSLESVGSSFDAGSGERGVPLVTRNMKHLLVVTGAQRFRLAGPFAAERNVLIQQRAVEYLYPARLDESAVLVFALVWEGVSGCDEIKREGMVSAYVCKH